MTDQTEPRKRLGLGDNREPQMGIAPGDCQRMAMALAAYNGGLGWVQRDKGLAKARGADPLIWWDQVERFNAGRSSAAFRENRGYPRRILRSLEPLYLSAGWGRGVCHE